MASETVDMVNHPPHYSGHPSGIECIDITRDMSFDAGNAVKYVYRCDAKNGREDLEKARWYLTDAVRHGDPVVVGATPLQWAARLAVVVRHEADLNRVRFFEAVRLRDMASALDSVAAMLDDTDA
jgi:hypothetical protein